VVALALAYGYWTVYRGFFPEYAVELVPRSRSSSGWSGELSQRFESGSLVRWAILLVTAYALVVYLAFRPGDGGDSPLPVLRYSTLALAPPWISWKRGNRWWPAWPWSDWPCWWCARPVVRRAERLKAIAVVGLMAGGWAAALAQQSRVAPGRFARVCRSGSSGRHRGVALDVASHSWG